jgi:hypothetical protein
MIGLTVNAGDNFKNRASIPLAPCIWQGLVWQNVQYMAGFGMAEMYSIWQGLVRHARGRDDGWSGQKTQYNNCISVYLVTNGTAT